MKKQPASYPKWSVQKDLDTSNAKDLAGKSASSVSARMFGDFNILGDISLGSENSHGLSMLLQVGKCVMTTMQYVSATHRFLW